MSTTVYLGKRQLSPELICEHVSTSQLLPQLLREIIIDEILAQWQPETQPQLAEPDTRVATGDLAPAGLDPHQGMNESQLMAIATRQLKIEQFKREAWGHQLGSHYLNRKAQLDRAICSVMQVDDAAVAQELFFRIQSGEKSFAELAFKYSQGPEARDGGKLGPIPVANLHPDIYRQIANLQPGELSPLFTVSNFYIFVRLEELIPAQFDDNLRQLLLDELFEKWLQDRISREIGLISVQTNVIPPDFMPEYQNFNQVAASPLGLLTPTIPTSTSIELDSVQSSPLSDPEPPLAAVEAAPIEVQSLPEVEPDSIAASAVEVFDNSDSFSTYSTSSFFLPQTTPPPPINYVDDEDDSNYRWLLIAAISIITLIFGVSSFYYFQATGSLNQTIEQSK